MNRVEPLDVVVSVAFTALFSLLSLRLPSKDARVYGVVLIAIGALSFLGGIAWRSAAYYYGWEPTVFVRPWYLLNNLAAVAAGILSMLFSLFKRRT